MDLARIRARGESRTGRGWATNPLRAVLWRLLLPYYQQTGDELEVRFRELETSLAAAREAWVGQQAQFGSRLGGLAKDQGALAARLAGMETMLHGIGPDALRALLAEIQHKAERAVGLADRVDLAMAAAAAVEARLEELQSRRARSNGGPPGGPGRMLPLNDGDSVALDDDGLILSAGPAGRFLLRERDLISQVLLGGAVWEPHVRDAIRIYRDPQRTAVDAGAHIGVHTVHLSRHFRHVHAFEPQAEIFRTLCANLILNGRRNVCVHQEAVSDRSGALRLLPPERQIVPMPTQRGSINYAAIGNAAALAFEKAQARAEGTVPARALDSLGLTDVGFLKIDTQGFDLAVLRGGKETIARCRPVVTFEHERDLGKAHGASLEEFRAFFADLNYRIELLAEITPDAQADYIALPT